MPFDANGLEISEYEAMRLKRITRNEAYLESLGLGDAKQKLIATMTAQTKRNATRRGARSPPKPKPGKERRSKRLTNKDKAPLVMLSYSDEKESVVEQVSDEDFEFEGDSDCNESVMVSSRQSRSRKYSIISNWKLTEEEKKVLQRNIDDSYLAKFKEFLLYHDQVSPANANNVMRQVSKLARGEGVRYESPKYGWAKGCYFMRGTKVTPMSDIVHLMQKAQQCEDMWGRDHGNGWLLSHPLKKLLLFQQFALNNPDFLTAKCKLKDYCALDDDHGLKKDTNFNASRASTEPDTLTMPKENDGKDVLPTVVSPPKSAAADGGKTTDNKSSQSSGPRVFLGTRVAKNFGQKTHFGTVSGHSSVSGFWHVNYDDGDEEDFEAKELKSALHHYKKKGANDFGAKKKKPNKSVSVVTTSPIQKSKRMKLR